MGYYDDASVLGLSALRRRRGCGEWAWRMGVAMGVAMGVEGRARWVMGRGCRHLHRNVARPRGGAHLGQIVPSVRRVGRAGQQSEGPAELSVGQLSVHGM